MWYCNQCGEWYEDSVTILRHFQVLHPSLQSPVRDEKSGGSASPSPNMSPVVKGKASPDMKEKFVPLMLKKKESEKLKNGLVGKRGIIDQVESLAKKKLQGLGNLPSSAAKSPVSSPESVPAKKIRMHVTNIKDPTFANKLASRNVEAEDLFEQIKTYICKFCCRRFSNAYSLRLHLQTHKDNPSHKCHVCGFVVSTFSALMAHYVKHSDFKITDLSSKNEVTSEMRKEPGKGKLGILCTKCKRTFSTKEVFVSHYCPPLNKKSEYVCTYCRKVTSTVEEYRDHIQSHSVAHFVCGHCCTKFETKANLQMHFKVCKKNPRMQSNMPGAKKGSQVAKQGPASKAKFKKLRPEKPASQPAGEKKRSTDNQLSLLEKIEKEVSRVVKQEPLSPAEQDADDDDISEISCVDTSGTESSHQVRGQRLKSGRISVTPVHTSPDKTIPTRRSARLVNKKQVKFSLASSDSDVDIAEEPDDRLRSPRRQRSPTKSAEPSPPSQLETPPSPTKAKQQKSPPKKDQSQQNPKLQKNAKEMLQTSPKSPKKCKEQPQKETKELVELVNLSPENCAEQVKESPADSAEEITQEPQPDKCTVKNTTHEGLKSKKCVKKGGAQQLARIKQQIAECKQTALICSQCSLIFRSKGSLKRHRKMHSGKPQFACQYCGKFFFRRDIHRRHESNVHPTPLERTLVCYYCKEKYDNSAELKEHSYEAHASKASAPERIRRCTPLKPSMLKELAIKSEPQSPTRDTAMDSETEFKSSGKASKSGDLQDGKDCIYNCGMCHITFQKPPDLVKHFEEVHYVSDNLNIVKLKAQESIKTEHEAHSDAKVTKVKKEVTEQSVHVPPSKNTTPMKSVKNSSGSSEISHEKPNNMCRKKSVSIRTPEKVDTPLPIPESFCAKELPSGDVCDLCHVPKPGTGPWMCNEKDVHKAVEWYQCKICAVYGPVDKIKEHMLQHMTKIGIFVVNNENQGTDSVSPHMPFQSKCPESSTDQDGEDQPLLSNLQISTDGEHLVDETPSIGAVPDALSVCSLMLEVKCKKCGDEILDCELLKSHPCLDSGETYTCFIENCEHSTEGREEMLKHLKESHVHMLYRDSRTVQTTEHCILDDDNQYDSDAVQLRVAETENILVEPCLEIITHMQSSQP